MTVRFQTSRFHIVHGPDELFERIHYKFNEQRSLKLHGKHFNERKELRAISDDVINSILFFDSDKWKLVTAEVRTDTGKFVNSTWEKFIGSDKYWISIGFGDVVQTIIKKDSEGLGYAIVKDGPLYQFVKEVNLELMRKDNL